MFLVFAVFLAPHLFPITIVGKESVGIAPDVKNIFDFKYEDFQLTDYDPWPHIKAVVSV